MVLCTVTVANQAKSCVWLPKPMRNNRTTSNVIKIISNCMNTFTSFLKLQNCRPRNANAAKSHLSHPQNEFIVRTHSSPQPRPRATLRPTISQNPLFPIPKYSSLRARAARRREAASDRPGARAFSATKKSPCVILGQCHVKPETRCF